MPPSRVRRARPRAGSGPATGWFGRMLAACLLVAVVLTGCTPAPAPSPTGSDAGPATAGIDTTFTFGTAADPITLDPALAVDDESYRVTRQVLETLVGVDPDTGAPAPLLATDWTVAENRKSYTFRLRRNVSFHDGTRFDAAAVCTNFSRWYHLPPRLQDLYGGVTFGSVFRAFADTPARSAFKDCTVLDTHRVRIDLRTQFTGFLSALSAPAFAISSPTALRSGAANQLTETRAGKSLSRYGQHPVGTGPFTFDGWGDDTVTLRANHDYWGRQSQIQKLVFRTLSHPEDRLRALKEGAIDGYDMASVNNIQPLAQAGLKVLLRDPYSVTYLGVNADYAPLDNRKVRRAIAHAIDKKALISKFFIDGTKPAGRFIPPKLGIPEEDGRRYDYDVEKAKTMLRQAGYDGEPIRFYYPRHVTRAYLPAPEKIYAELSRQLTAVGLNIEPVPIEWSDNYLSKVQSDGNHGLHLLGWSGSYLDPDNFIGSIFDDPEAEFGFSSPQLQERIDHARTLKPGPARKTAYRKIGDRLADRVPAVPLAFPISAIALSDRVAHYPVSPVMNEVFNKVVLTR